MIRNSIEGVAYDLDGTLYPNYRLNLALIPFLLREWRFLLAFGKARDIIRAAQELPAGAGAAKDAPDFYAAQARLIAGILGAEPARIQEKVETLIYRGWEPLFKKIKLFPGVKETLGAFRDAGLRQGLLSDFPPERKLEYLGLSAYWDAALCSERSGRLKPDPRPFWELAEALGVSPERLLYVGNSQRCDVAGAKRAGMKTALISFSPRFWGRNRGAADFIFHDYRQLLNYVLS
ncbi:MAG: HAD family hydrolase [Treponema sp.]|jgi:putative hydrolase of the HAD superfamily|nr:HAD family hydrolase [Treponema sp.]